VTLTEKRLAGLVREYWGIDLSNLPAGCATPMRELRIDSLDIVEMTMAVEEEWSITIHDDEMETFGPDLPQGKTLADLARLIDAKLIERVA
jgi:acyl carrier protein